MPGGVLRRLAARYPERYPVLFDSAAEGPLSRTSVLVAEPRAALWLNARGELGGDGLAPTGDTFLEALENWWLAERSAPAAAGLPFVGGATPSRIARIEKIASITPAAPSRCPVIDFVELTARRRA